MCCFVFQRLYDNYKKNTELLNIDKIKLDNNNFLFHAGTSKNKDKILSVGGRVLNFVSLSENFVTARKNIFKNIDILDWDNGFYRKDIGHKVIKP